MRQELTVQQALDAIRERGVGEKIVYFYVVDADERLAGVLPLKSFRLSFSPVWDGSEKSGALSPMASMG